MMELCKYQGLPEYGSKKVLVQRLMDAAGKGKPENREHTGTIRGGSGNKLSNGSFWDLLPMDPETVPNPSNV